MKFPREMDVECIYIYTHSFYRYLSTGISFFDKMCITFNVYIKKECFKLFIYRILPKIARQYLIM